MRISILLGALLLVGCTQVDTGTVGIKKRFGEIVEGPLPEGLHFYNILTSSIFTLDVREQKLQEVAMCYTKDTQTASVNYAVNFYVERGEIVNLYKTVGTGWVDKVVRPVVESNIKDTTGQFVADELIGKREAVTQIASEKIKIALKSRGVIIKDLNFVNIDFNDAYEAAVEAKSVARQKAEEAKNKTVEIEEQGRQVVITAEADAKSMKIRADALVQNRSLMEWETIKRWNGALPQYLTSGSAIPFLNINAERKK